MLDRVPLLEKDLDQYAAIVGDDAVDRIRSLAEPLRGARVLHLNATPYGGGVAELLATHVPLLRSVGLDAEWQVMNGSDDFFAVTKQVHNALQGAHIDWTPEMQRTYLEKLLDNALLIEGEYDFVVAHDPQPAALLSFLGDSPVTGRRPGGSGAVTSTSPMRIPPSGSSSARTWSATTPRCGRCRPSCPSRCRWTPWCSPRRASIRSA